MGTTDPISDMLTRIRNANMVFHPFADIPHSRLKEEIARVLREEKYIKDYEILEEKGGRYIRVHLLYFPGRRRAISTIERVSKPGTRIYQTRKRLPVVKEGYGLAVLSTSRGIMSNRKAKDEAVGGEVLFQVW